MQTVAVEKIMPQVSASTGSAASDGAAAEGLDFAALLAAQFLGKDGTALPVVGVETAAEAQLRVEGGVQDIAAKDFKSEVVPDSKPSADLELQAMMLMPGFAPVMQASPEIKPKITSPSLDKSLGDRTINALPGFAEARLTQAKNLPPVLSKEGAAEFAVDGKSLPTGDAKIGDAKIGDAKIGDAKIGDAKIGDAKIGDAKLGDAKLGDAKLGDAKLGDAKLGDAKLGDAKLGDAKLGDAKLGDAKLGDAKLGDTKLIDTSKLPTLPADVPRVPDASSAVSALMNASQTRAVSEIKIPLGNVRPPVGASGWGDALGQKIVWMAGQHQQVAELHLNPPNLGPMEVRLTISNDQVSALFVSHQPAVREAIEAAMPRLREMFADSGMALGNATVSSDSLPQRHSSGHERQSGAESRPDFPLADGYSIPVTSRGIMHLPGDGRGLVDLFA